MSQMIKTLKIRLKDKHASVMSAMSREVNFVWNFCNETSSRAIREKHKFLSGFDLQKLTDGFSKCEGVRIGSATTQQVCEEYATRRKQFKKTHLNWRVSNRKSPKYSLGWIPFKSRALTYKAGQVRFCGMALSVWDSYGLSQYEFRAGSFSEDSRGRWYLNVQVAIPELCGPVLPAPTASLGIDLGLKTAATCSNGSVFEGRIYRKHEAALGIAQRAGKKARVRAIHAKMANTRKNALHHFSSDLVKRSGAIFVGNVSSQAMVKTTRAKSTLDAGWSMFKTMLEYKCKYAGVVFEVVNEAWSTQMCSSCGSVEGPKGQAELDVREWTCSCGAHHDRDVNAALNIRAKGLAQFAISKAAEVRADEPALNKDSGALRSMAEVGHDLPAGGITVL
jgi:IS605 OrfB family transposase